MQLADWNPADTTHRLESILLNAVVKTLSFIRTGLHLTIFAGEPQRGSILFFIKARRRQNLSDVRLKTCAVECVFYIRALVQGECTWKYRSISSNSLTQLDKRGEI